MKMDDALLGKIAGTYGTPLYVYDREQMELQYRKLKAMMPPEFAVFYSLKANPLLGIAGIFNRLGCGIEVASAGELYTALQSGCHPGDIIFTSPGKTLEELEYAVASGIYSINVESVAEAELINGIGSRCSKPVNITIRINPDFNLSGAGIKMTGVPTQFGIDQSQIPEAFGVINALPFIKVIGIHIYTGTQMLSAANILANMEAILQLALDVAERYQFKLEFLDLGGGFGVPYFPADTALDETGLADGMAVLWERYRNRLQGVKMAIESGRYLLAESGYFLTKVLYVKESKGVRYAVCDGGSNHHANSAFLGRHVRNNFPIHVLDKRGGDLAELNVVGPLCTPTDLIGQKLMLPPVVPGDIIVIEKSGAYGLTNSPFYFLSHPFPAEVIHYQGNVTIVRERGKIEDFLKGQWINHESN